MNKHTPIWILDDKDKEQANFPVLKENLDCDTVIVGGGLVGLLTAYHLIQLGQNVVVLEANRIMHGVSGHTTAKITSQHDIIYTKIINRFGLNTAKLYAEANQTAIERYNDIITNENIECEFKRQDASLYTRSPNKVSKLLKETQAAKNAGIEADFSRKSNLPFPVEGIMTFRNQAMFNPYMFGTSIADCITKAGGKIYENSRVFSFSDEQSSPTLKPYVQTQHATVHAKSIVMATNFPLINFPGWYFARLYQSRSYLMAFKNTQKLDGYYLSIDKDEKTIRMYKDYLLVGGESHKTGKKGNIDHYGKINSYANEIFSKPSFKSQWSAQDSFTLDGLPYVGRYSQKTPNIYVATGFHKWGMTNSMVAGMIISDLITQRHNKWAKIYSPQRPMVPVAYARLIYNVIRFAYNFISGWITAPFKKTPTCTHMGCKLSNNHCDGTYDCACHGSRFTESGNVLHAPAKRRLANKDEG